MVCMLCKDMTSLLPDSIIFGCCVMNSAVLCTARSHWRHLILIWWTGNLFELREVLSAWLAWSYDVVKPQSVSLWDLRDAGFNAIEYLHGINFHLEKSTLIRGKLLRFKKKLKLDATRQFTIQMEWLRNHCIDSKYIVGYEFANCIIQHLFSIQMIQLTSLASPLTIQVEWLKRITLNCYKFVNFIIQQFSFVFNPFMARNEWFKSLWIICWHGLVLEVLSILFLTLVHPNCNFS